MGGTFDPAGGYPPGGGGAAAFCAILGGGGMPWLEKEITYTIKSNADFCVMV
jgi:hypothetical protein